MTDFVSAFVGGLPPTLREQAETEPGWGPRITALLQEAAREWPQLGEPDEAFVEHLAARLPHPGTLTDLLEQVRPADLYLAWQCSRGNATAVAGLENAYLAQLGAIVAKIATDVVPADDLHQIIRNKLYVATKDGPPALDRYNGMGSLNGWLRVVATRTALNAIRTKGPKVVGMTNFTLDDVTLADDPELDYIKEHYRGTFKDAFQAAVNGLPARERTLLNYSILHRLGARDIGQMYGVHHSTVARWLVAARQQIVQGTRDQLAERLGVGGEPLESIMQMIQSRIDVSVARVLDTPPLDRLDGSAPSPDDA